MPAAELDHPLVTIRPARLTDRAAVWTLVQDFAESYRPQAPAFTSAFDRAVEHAGTLVLVAETDERDLVGYLLAHAHATFFANADVCWIEELMVDEGVRRKQIGRHLMSAAEEWARDREVAYTCLASRRATAFYRAVGYSESATLFKKPVADG